MDAARSNADTSPDAFAAELAARLERLGADSDSTQEMRTDAPEDPPPAPPNTPTPDVLDCLDVILKLPALHHCTPESSGTEYDQYLEKLNEFRIANVVSANPNRALAIWVDEERRRTSIDAAKGIVKWGHGREMAGVAAEFALAIMDREWEEEGMHGDLRDFEARWESLIEKAHDMAGNLQLDHADRNGWGTFTRPWRAAWYRNCFRKASDDRWYEEWWAKVVEKGLSMELEDGEVIVCRPGYGQDYMTPKQAWRLYRAFNCPDWFWE
ncbi:MAG: hypothetical protein Q9162_004468 [Coniocarpon cinnabarinum]